MPEPSASFGELPLPAPDRKAVPEQHAGSERCVVLEVGGELDLATGPELQGRLTDLIDSGVCEVVLDLTEVSFLDSSGLSVLVMAMKRLRAGGGTLRLAGCQSQVQTILELTALSRVFPLYPTAAAALAGRADATPAPA